MGGASAWSATLLGGALLLGACAVPNPAFSPAADGASSDRTPPTPYAPPASTEDADAGARPGADGALPLARDPSFANNIGSVAATVCPARADLALCVRFEGATVDDSPSHVSLGVQNVAFASGGPGGEAADLGPTSLIRLPDDPLFDLGAVTVEAWVNPRTTARRMGIVDYNGQYGMIMLAGGTIACMGSGGGTNVTAGPIAAGVWTSLACTWDATMASVWIDGVKVASQPRPGPLKTASTYGITLGSDGPDGNPLDGLLDNVRIWKVVRSAADICAGAHHCP